MYLCIISIIFAIYKQNHSNESEAMGYNITITAIAVLITIAIIYFSLQHKNKLKTANKTNSTNKTDTSDADNSSAAYAGMKPRELCKAILHDLNCKT